MYLHRWQQDALISMLGPFAPAFGLDEWIDKLESLQTRVLLPRDKWAWVLLQFEAELQRRHLLDTPEKEHWTDRCPHTPVCGNATNCENAQAIAAYKATHAQD